MTEVEWARIVAEKIGNELPDKYGVATNKKLYYANEIKAYLDGKAICHQMPYKTDILIYEGTEDSWVPRVVIETKVNRITTHTAITYSQKAMTHKFVHPYLRYGILVCDRKKTALPGRLFRHGVYFDFMVSWQLKKAKDYEWSKFISIIKKEITASKKLEEMIFNNLSKYRDKFFAIHKPLVTSDAK